MKKKQYFLILVLMMFNFFDKNMAQIPDVTQTRVYQLAEPELKVWFDKILLEDPALKQAKAETSMNQSKSEGLDVLPNPELGVNWSPQPMQKSLNQTLAFRAMQTMPWPGTIKASVDVQNAITEQMKWMELARKTERLLSFQKAWYEVYRTKKQAQLIEEQLNWIDAQLADLMTKLTTGVSQSARIELSIEQLKFKQMKREFEQKTVSAESVLHSFLVNDIAWQFPDTLIYQKTENGIFSERHPLVLALDSKQKSNRFKHELAKKEGLPMIGLGAEYMFIDEAIRPAAPEMQMQNAITLMATISLPIYRKKVNAMKKEAISAQNEALYESDKMVLELKSMFETLVKMKEIKQNEFELYHVELPKKWQELELLAHERWQTGSGSYAELIRIQREKIELKRMAIDALVELKITDAELAWNQQLGEMN